jgi:translation initiation factor RLI1
VSFAFSTFKVLLQVFKYKWTLHLSEQRIVQRFSTIKLLEGEKLELAGVEKQRITLVMSISEGCNVELS